MSNMLLHYSQVTVCPVALFPAVDMSKDSVLGVCPKVCHTPRRPYKNASAHELGVGSLGTPVLTLNYSSPDDKNLGENNKITHSGSSV